MKLHCKPLVHLQLVGARLFGFEPRNSLDILDYLSVSYAVLGES